MMQDNIVQVQNVEYIEFAVRNLDAASQMYEKMGFELAGARHEGARKSRLYVQGDIHLILTASSSESDHAFRFTRAHGDGVCDIGLTVSDAQDAHQRALKLGAEAVGQVTRWRGEAGQTQTRGTIQAYGDVVHTFVSYDGKSRLNDFFPEQRQAGSAPAPKGRFFQTIDHITVNVEKGQMERWAKFYKELFGFYEVRYFDIRTDKSGLVSRALRSPNGRFTMPINEPTNDKSQIQEFLDTFKGPGVQHIAFHVSNIVLALDSMKREGFGFLSVPDTYYEAVPKRVPKVVESLDELKKHQILVDGSEKGYLLQIFSETLVGPLFYELIQRRGDNGFGDGNFRALFEAIERDQERRGVI